MTSSYILQKYHDYGTWLGRIMDLICNNGPLFSPVKEVNSSQSRLGSGRSTATAALPTRVRRCNLPLWIDLYATGCLDVLLDKQRKVAHHYYIHHATGTMVRFHIGSLSIFCSQCKVRPCTVCCLALVILPITMIHYLFRPSIESIKILHVTWAEDFGSSLLPLAFYMWRIRRVYIHFHAAMDVS